MATKKKTGGSGNRGIVMTVVVGALAIVMVLTMMLPSLSLIFASRKSDSASQSSAEITPTTVAEADAKYQPTVDTLQEQLDADPNSLSALANLGYAYYDWASSVRTVIQTIESNAASAEATAAAETPATQETPATSADAQAADASTQAAAETPATQAEASEAATSPDTASTPETPAQAVTVDDRVHQEDLFRRAEGYFDRYLALSDSDSVSVSRILCEYYLGNEQEATAQLAEFCKNHDFGPAWANLGMMYATAGEMDQAKSAFESAKTADPNDEYGSKTYAEQYLAYIEQIEQLTSSITSSSGETTTTVNSDGTSVITLDGSNVSGDGTVAVSGSGAGSSATSSTGSSASSVSAAPTTSLKDSVGGLF